MNTTLLVMILLDLVTLGNGKHYVKHCRNAPQGCEERMMDIAPVIVSAAEEYNLPELLITTIAFRETGLNPKRRGTKGEKGLMQIMPSNIRPGDYKRDPYLIHRGAELLRLYIDDCKNLRGGISTYNAGMNLGRCPKDTVYTGRVMRKYRWLKRKWRRELQYDS